MIIKIIQFKDGYTCQYLYTTSSYNNNIFTNLRILKALHFKKKMSADFKLCFKLFIDFDCFNINEGEFQLV